MVWKKIKEAGIWVSPQQAEWIIKIIVLAQKVGNTMEFIAQHCVYIKPTSIQRHELFKCTYLFLSGYVYAGRRREWRFDVIKDNNIKKISCKEWWWRGAMNWGIWFTEPWTKKTKIKTETTHLPTHYFPSPFGDPCLGRGTGFLRDLPNNPTFTH